MDHNSLKYFLEQDLNERQQQWINKIQAYDFDIVYVKGKRKEKSSWKGLKDNVLCHVCKGVTC